jgi:hypothetical protein
MAARAAGHGRGMALLFRLPLMLLELLLRRLFHRGDDDVTAAVFTPDAARGAGAPTWAPTPETPEPEPEPEPETEPGPGGGAFTGATTNGAPPPTADEAIARRREREAAEAAAPDPEPLTPLRPIGQDDHVDREATVVESFGPAEDVGDVGGTITVDAPWAGYDDDNATAIVTRLRGADAATKAVVALYERQHKNRATVLRATQ